MPDFQYPEHEKLKALGDRNDEIQAFIDWLYDDQDLVVAARARENAAGFIVRDDESSRLWSLTHVEDHPIHSDTSRGKSLREKIMAAYFSIDLRKISDEKDQMLRDIRAVQK